MRSSEGRRSVNTRSTPASRSRPMASRCCGVHRWRGGPGAQSRALVPMLFLRADGSAAVDGQSGCTSWHLMTTTPRRGSGPKFVVPGCNDDVMSSTASPDAVVSPAERLKGLFEELAELAGQRNAIDGRIVQIVAEMDRDELCGATGARSIAALVAWKLGASSANAKTIATIAGRLAVFPRCAAGMREGRLSLDQVGVIAAQAADGSDAHYAELASCATVNQLRTAVKLEPRPEPEPEHHPRPDPAPSI